MNKKIIWGSIIIVIFSIPLAIFLSTYKFLDNSAEKPNFTVRPKPPTNLQSTRISTESADIVWKDNSNNEQFFNFSYTPIGVKGEEETTIKIPENNQKLGLTGLLTNKRYKITVQSCNLVGCSESLSTEFVVAKVAPTFNIIYKKITPPPQK